MAACLALDRSGDTSRKTGAHSACGESVPIANRVVAALYCLRILSGVTANQTDEIAMIGFPKRYVNQQFSLDERAVHGPLVLVLSWCEGKSHEIETS